MRSCHFIERNIPAPLWRPHEVALLVAFLPSPQAVYIIGVAIPIDGAAL
jgi:NAD(P)-dependent dehydrogenase (short-subunit alcohol dehydrogenase family)